MVLYHEVQVIQFLYTWNLLGTFSFWEGTPMAKSIRTIKTMVRNTAKSLIIDRT